MKKRIAFTIILLFVASSTVLAQSYAIDKGSFQIAGMIGYQSMGGDLYEDADENRSTTINVSPGIRYFVAPKIAIGGDILYERTSQGDYSNTTLGIGPVVIIAFGDSKTKTYPYIGGGFLFASNTDKDVDVDWWTGEEEEVEHKTTGSDIMFGGGIIHMVSKNLGIMAELSYHIQSMKPEEGESHSGNVIWFRSGLTGFIF